MSDLLALDVPKVQDSRMMDIEITPLQQMISSCTGSLITSILVTPLDVVKIRLQAQQKEFTKNKCFLYCNGLMDHVCYCLNGNNGQPQTIQNSKNMLNNINNYKGNQPIHLNTICNHNSSNNNSNSVQNHNCSSNKQPKINLNLFNNNKTQNNIHCSYHSISVKNLTDQQIKDLWYRRPNYFNGTMDGLIKIARYEGVTSLWSGLPPTLVMAIPATVMYFTIYDQMVSWMRKKSQIDRDSRTSILIPAIAGGSARFVAATVISPLEMIRTKMQSQKLSYKEIGKAIQELIRSQGILRMWTGLSATLLRDVPFSMLYWLNYENFKRIFQMYDYNFGFSFLAGAVSGSIAATITLPFDVVKTYRQIELGQAQLISDKKTSKDTFTIMKKIYQERGYRGLFAGIAPRLIKVAPACAIMISTYETGKSFFRNYNRSKLIQQQQQQK